MALTVKEACQLKTLKALELVAGASGINKAIDKIGILDHEVVTGIHGSFSKGDFVLTSFVAVRNNEAYLEKCIKDLITCNISALVIKKVFYHQLPSSITELANAHSLPIFFVEEKVYFEDIIEDLLEGMHIRSHMELLETKVELLFKNSLKSNVVKSLAKELNHSFQDHLIVLYLKERAFTSNNRLLKISERYQRSRTRSEHHSILKYNEGLLIILSYDTYKEKYLKLDFDYICEQMLIDKCLYDIGVSRPKNLSTIDYGIKEAIYASQTGESYKLYESIGIYKLVMPYKNDIWLKSFVEETLEPLIEEEKLLETAELYVYNKGDMKKTSEMLFQHINSTRYRLNKIKTLMSIETDFEVYEILSLAFKCKKVMEE